MIAIKKRTMIWIASVIAALLIISIGVFHFFFQSSYEAFDLDYDVNFNGKVIVVGAGASGLTAGYILGKKGIDYKIIEATDEYGGRMKKLEGFADFPIDLGAEWIHEDPEILNYMAQVDDATEDIEIINYRPRTHFDYSDGELSNASWRRFFYREYKFKDSTWLDFFEKYIIPEVKDNIIFNRAVSEINYSGSQTILKTVDGTTFEPAEEYTTDKTLVTVPISVLQQEYITFSPALDSEKKDAINSITMSPGFKMFIKFEETFYPDLLSIDEDTDGTEEFTVYDATFGKDTNDNVMGVLCASESCQKYIGENDEETKQNVIQLIDEIYNGKATETFIDSTAGYWSNRPFIGGTYSTEIDGEFSETLDIIQEPLDKKVYFSGSALSKDRWSTVPGASETAYLVVREMLNET